MGEKGFQLVLNGTERDRLVVSFYFRESLRTALRLHSREQNNDSARVGSHIRTPALQVGTDTTVHSTVSPDAEQWTLQLDLLSLLLLTPGQHTATSAMCAKAFSPVPASLCHHVLSQSPACGNLQECLETRFSVLWRKVGSVYYQDCQVWWWFIALSHVRLLRPH